MSSSKYWVSIYEETQHYGGPEEGGWWFTRRRWKESTGYATREEALAEASRVGSSTYLGDDEIVLVERTPGSREYLGTPRYE